MEEMSLAEDSASSGQRGDKSIEEAGEQPAAPPGGRGFERALEAIAAVGEEPVALSGDRGLLTSLVADVLQIGLEVELAGHLGHDRWEWASRGAANIRNGAYTKRVATDLGAITLQMPRDRLGTFDPVIVPKHGRRLLIPTSNIAAIYASTMTRGELRALIESVTESRLEAKTVERYVDVLEPRITAWQRRRFHSSCPVLLVDAITLFGRGKRPSRRSLDVAVAVDAYGEAALLGLWRRRPRTPGVARYMAMLDELRYRGISSVEIVVGGDDGDLGTAARLVWPGSAARPGVADLVENVLRPD